MKIVKKAIRIKELKEMAQEGFGNLVKAVVDIKKGIMVVGGEFHADEEVLLIEQEKSRREDTWGINFRLEETGEEFIEFDSMINIKPAFGNRSRGVDNPEIREKIKEIASELIDKS